MTGNYATDLGLLVLLVWLTLCALLVAVFARGWARERREYRPPPGYDETEEEQTDGNEDDQEW